MIISNCNYKPMRNKRQIDSIQAVNKISRILLKTNEEERIIILETIMNLVKFKVEK